MIRIRGPRVLAANRTFSSLGNGFELKIVALTSVEFNISGILNSLNTFRYQFTSIEAAHKYPHYAIISKVFEFLITYLNHMLFFSHYFSFRFVPLSSDVRGKFSKASAERTIYDRYKRKCGVARDAWLSDTGGKSIRFTFFENYYSLLNEWENKDVIILHAKVNIFES